MLTHTKIFHRLIALVALMLVLMGVIGLAGYSGMSSTRESLRTVYLDRTAPLVALSDISDHYYEIRLNVLEALSSGDAQVAAKKQAKIETEYQQIKQLWATYMATYLTPEEKNLAARMEQAMADYDKARAATMSYAVGGDFEAARQNAGTGGAAAAFAALTKASDAIKELQARVAKEEYDASVVRGQRNMMLLIGLLVASVTAGLAVAVLIGRSVTVPLTGVIAVMRELTGGNLAVKVVGQDRRDEVGDVIRAVEIFKEGLVEAEQLRRQQEQLQKEQELAKEQARLAEEKSRQEKEAEKERQRLEQEQRTKRLADLAAAFDRQASGLLQAVSSASTQLNMTAESMAATAEETNRQASVVAVASEQTSGNVQMVATATEELSVSITEIGRQVSRSAQISQKAVDEANVTSERVQTLDEAARKIDRVVSLINEIAGQTNLLALNATIEAARAGDAGKGFAVVASEVKALATQTARATEEIAIEVAGIQGATTATVSAIADIRSTIVEVNEIAAAIAAGIEQQGAATQEIASNIQQAAAGTQEVSSNITGVTKAAADTGAAASQVLSAATELATQSTALQSEVGRFLSDIQAA